MHKKIIFFNFYDSVSYSNVAIHLGATYNLCSVVFRPQGSF